MISLHAHPHPHPILLLLAGLCALALPVTAKPAPSCGEQSDFLVRPDPTLAPVRPMDCSTITQTPPEFTWPPQQGANTYAVVLRFPNGQTHTRTTSRNWLLWDRTLPPGSYSWQVQVSGNSNHTSEPRKFTIAPNATAFIVPAGETLLRNAREAPRPRTWSRDATRPMSGIEAERAGGFRNLVAEVGNKMADPVQAEPKSGSDNANYEDTVAEQKRTMAVALAYAVTRERRYGEDAVRRMMAQAQWSTEGAISYKKNDMANRNVAWTLALAYDWVHDYLEPGQKKAILAAIRARTEPMYADVVSRLGAYPYDSHANLTLTIVAAIGALTAGDIPEADRWLKDVLPLAVVWTSPWGWQDGGFANGTAQLFWDTGSNLPAWYVLRNAAGVDLAQKEWVRNHARFMAYFVPPGAPSGVFGDGHELDLKEVWSRVSKATARFAPTPIGRWYARSMGNEDQARVELMLSPRVDLARATLPEGTPDSAYFPSVGWVAMHSGLSDPERTSVYFKSSPYGSYNHSHGDQNSFVIHQHGERLVMASGYYDGYQTPHWKEWYKQTRATNAITFDGGKGQGFNGKQFSGEITRFESGDGYDIATGRAEKAYGGELTRAQRSIVYLRPNVVLVHDSLASDTPRTWEWNIHALRKMAKLGDKLVQVRNGAAKMCLEMLVSPQVTFEQADQFTAAPSGKDMPNQWHGAFVSGAKSRSAEFVALMRIGAECTSRTSPARLLPTAEGLQVEVDGAAVVFSPDGAKVQRKAAAPQLAKPATESVPG